MKLWDKKPLKSYGVKISEAVLVILCSILKGESEIAERLSKEKPTAAAATPSGAAVAPPPTPPAAPEAASTTICPAPVVMGAQSSTPPAEQPISTEATPTSTTVTASEAAPRPPAGISPEHAPGALPAAPASLETNSGPPTSSGSAEARPLLLPVDSTPATGSSDAPPAAAASAAAPSSEDSSHPILQALLDMGFPHERCLEAISHTNNLEQATEYLLSNPLGSHVSGRQEQLRQEWIDRPWRGFEPGVVE